MRRQQENAINGRVAHEQAAHEQAGSAMDDANERAFWRDKRLDELSGSEWERLCDGCGRCCLNKLEDWDTGAIAWTNVRCKLLDDGSCRCSDYPNRRAAVPDCIPLDVKAVREIAWLPPTCAYRLVAEGRDLYWWHHLVSGDPDTVHQAGVSVRGRTISEEGLDLDDFEEHLANWPGEDPMEEAEETRVTGRVKE